MKYRPSPDFIITLVAIAISVSLLYAVLDAASSYQPRGESAEPREWRRDISHCDPPGIWECLREAQT